MAHILAPENFTSDRIRDKMDEAYLVLGDDRYQEILGEFGFTPDTAPATPSAKVKRILVLFVSAWVCRDRMGISLQQSVDGVAEDPWEKLYKAYWADYQDAILGLTADNLAGVTPDLDGMTGTIHRGG